VLGIAWIFPLFSAALARFLALPLAPVVLLALFAVAYREAERARLSASTRDRSRSSPG